MHKNRAFTLPEILVAMVILGVTMLIGYSAFRNYDERTIAKSYAKAYNTLATASYNIQNEVVEFNKKANFEAQENGSAVASAANLKKFPFVASNASLSATNLKTKLMEYINNKGSHSSPPGPLSNLENFVASDGMIYYFETNVVAGFFTVWVDINGTRRPNTNMPGAVKYPDIVPFLVHSELGEVVPAGYPTYNSKYSVSRVIYSDPDRNTSYSAPMTFRQAQYAAYHGQSFTQDPFSQTRNLTIFNNTIPSGFSAPTETVDADCNPQGYASSEFPPCTIQVNTKF